MPIVNSGQRGLSSPEITPNGATAAVRARDHGAWSAGINAGMPRQTERYHPPINVETASLADLLGGYRSVKPEQQNRLTFYDGKQGFLWCAGDKGLVQRPAVAIVGTRNVSLEGAARARRLARDLANAGVVIVSGLAKGVDTQALTSAIEHEGRVIAVIGTPIDRAYPAENKALQERIYTDHLLISQFKPGTRVFPSHFPERNKLMAAISDATVIIEASDTSGTLHQAAECVRLERWLFIARSVLDDKALTWPTGFEKYERMLPLEQSDDVLNALHSQWQLK
jgi:DNA processing protein